MAFCKVIYAHYNAKNSREADNGFYCVDYLVNKGYIFTILGIVLFVYSPYHNKNEKKAKRGSKKNPDTDTNITRNSLNFLHSCAIIT